MRQNWLLIGAIVAVLAIPFGLAAFEDSTRAKIDESKSPSEDGESYLSADLSAQLDDEGDEEEEVIGEWKRADELDLKFLDDGVSRKRPWVSEQVSALLVEDRAGYSDLDEFVAAFGARYGDDYFIEVREGSPAPGTIAFTFPASRNVLRVLSRRWGAPSYENPDSTIWAWFDPREKRRAVLELDGSSGELAFSTYTTVSALLEDAILGDYEAADIAANARSEFGPESVTVDSESITVEFPPTRAAQGSFTEVLYRTKAGSITSVIATIDFALDERAIEKLESILTDRFGAPEIVPGSGELAFSSGLRLHLGGDSVVIEKSR